MEKRPPVGHNKWQAAKAWDEICALNVDYLRGILRATPYAEEPVDKKIQPWVEALVELNRKGLFTIQASDFSTRSVHRSDEEQNSTQVPDEEQDRAHVSFGMRRGGWRSRARAQKLFENLRDLKTARGDPPLVVSALEYGQTDFWEGSSEQVFSRYRYGQDWEEEVALIGYDIGEEDPPFNQGRREAQLNQRIFGAPIMANEQPVEFDVTLLNWEAGNVSDLICDAISRTDADLLPGLSESMYQEGAALCALSPSRRLQLAGDPLNSTATLFTADFSEGGDVNYGEIYGDMAVRMLLQRAQETRLEVNVLNFDDEFSHWLVNVWKEKCRLRNMNIMVTAPRDAEFAEHLKLMRVEDMCRVIISFLDAKNIPYTVIECDGKVSGSWIDDSALCWTSMLDHQFSMPVHSVPDASAKNSSGSLLPVPVSAGHSEQNPPLLQHPSQHSRETIERLVPERRRSALNNANPSIFGHGGALLAWAIREGCEELVDMLLMDDNLDVNDTLPGDRFLGTPLWMATIMGNFRLVQRLLERRGIDVNSRESLHETPLAVACAEVDSQYINITEALLKHPNIDVNLGSEKATPLQIACIHGNIKVLKMLVKRPDVNANAQSCGSTSLHLTCRSGNIAVVTLLLSAEHLDLEIRDLRGQTAQDVATAAGHKEIADILSRKSMGENTRRHAQVRNAAQVARLT